MVKKIPEREQHFLENEKILDEEITLAKLSRNDVVVEIGAGDGRLTKLISEKARFVFAYEKDERFRKTLDKLNLKNVKFVFGDALKEKWQRHEKIVSNIPYSLSGSLIEKAIKEETKELTLIVGKKFKEILEKRETKIGVVANLYFEINFFREVKKNEFSPKPRTNSYLIQLKRKKPTEIESVLQAILEKDCKTKNAILKTLVGLGRTKNSARKILDEMNLSSETLEKSVKSVSGKFIEKVEEKLRELRGQL